MSLNASVRTIRRQSSGWRNARFDEQRTGASLPILLRGSGNWFGHIAHNPQTGTQGGSCWVRWVGVVHARAFPKGQKDTDTSMLKYRSNRTEIDFSAICALLDNLFFRTTFYFYFLHLHTNICTSNTLNLKNMLAAFVFNRYKLCSK